MHDRVLYFRLAIDHVVEKDSELKPYLLSDDEWEKMPIIHNFLRVFYNVTTDFSASKTPTTNIYFKGVWDIQCMLLEVVNGPHNLLVDMVKEMQKKFDKYWPDYNLLLSCAIVLDPRFKLKFVKYCYTVLYGEERDLEKVEEVRSLLCELLKQYRDIDGEGVGNSGDHCEVTTASVITPISSDIMAGYSAWMSMKEESTMEKSQLELYLEEKNVDCNSKHDVLGWWKNNGAPRQPQLASLARDILAIPISSALSESAFSMGKKLFNPWRASLISMTIETLACYEDWLRAKGFSLGRSLFDVQEDEDEDEREHEVEKDDCEIID